MLSGLGRGLVKQRPQRWHWTTANHKPVPPVVVSGDSTKADHSRLPHKRQSGSSHSMAGGVSTSGAASSRGKKLIPLRPLVSERGVRPLGRDSNPEGE